MITPLAICCLLCSTALASFAFRPILWIYAALVSGPYLWLLSLGDFSIENLWIMAFSHVLVSCETAYLSRPPGKERAWLLLMAVIVAAPFAWVAATSDPGSLVTFQDRYAILTASCIAASAIGLFTGVYCLAFDMRKAAIAPLLMGAYFAVDVAVNAAVRLHPFRPGWSIMLLELDLAGHLVVMMTALGLLLYGSWLARPQSH